MSLETATTPTRSTGLPEELRSVAVRLEKAVETKGDVSGIFAEFCARAYVKPDWAGPSSEFLADLFTDKERELAAMARIPDLIIELASGQETLTMLVAFQWAAQGDTVRLSKLAEALAATHTTLHSPEVVHLMLALATSLAVKKYPRAQQILHVAELHALPEHEESLQEAREWLDIGAVLRSCSQETRDLFDHRLRRKKSTWKWDSAIEQSCLQELADHLEPDHSSVKYFRGLVPESLWSAIQQKAEQRRIEEAAEQERTKLAAEALIAPSPAIEPAAEPLPEVKVAEEPPAPGLLHEFTHAPEKVPTTMHLRPISRSAEEVADFLPPEAPLFSFRGLQFFLGGLAGILIFIVCFHLLGFELRRKKPKDVSSAPTGSVVAPAAPPADGVAPPEAPQAPQPPSPPVPPQLSEADLVRLGEVERMQRENPQLLDLCTRVKASQWSEVEALLSGNTPDLPKSSGEHAKLLIWLHLDPPSDADIRMRLPGLLAEVRPDSDTIDLWTLLNYPESPMKEAIAKEIPNQLHRFEDRWSFSQEVKLKLLL